MSNHHNDYHRELFPQPITPLDLFTAPFEAGGRVGRRLGVWAMTVGQHGVSCETLLRPWWTQTAGAVTRRWRAWHRQTPLASHSGTRRAATSRCCDGSRLQSRSRLRLRSQLWWSQATAVAHRVGWWLATGIASGEQGNRLCAHPTGFAPWVGLRHVGWADSHSFCTRPRGARWHPGRTNGCKRGTAGGSGCGAPRPQTHANARRGRPGCGCGCDFGCGCGSDLHLQVLGCADVEGHQTLWVGPRAGRQSQGPGYGLEGPCEMAQPQIGV